MSADEAAEHIVREYRDMTLAVAAPLAGTDPTDRVMSPDAGGFRYLTGHPGIAGAIASTEVLTKMVLYYFHERAWSSVGWGVDDTLPDPAAQI